MAAIGTRSGDWGSWSARCDVGDMTGIKVPAGRATHGDELSGLILGEHAKDAGVFGRIRRGRWRCWDYGGRQGPRR